MIKMVDASKLKGSDKFYLSKVTVLSEVLEKSPRTAELLSEYGLNCVNCAFSVYDTLETGAVAHGMTQEEIDTMIDEINEQLRKEERN